MITSEEQEAIMGYMESLLIQELIDPIIVKHVKDEDVVAACFDKAYAILNELNSEIDNHCHDMLVDERKRTK